MPRLFVPGFALIAATLFISAVHAGQEPSKAAEQRITEAEKEIQALWRSYYTVVKDDLPDNKASVDCSAGSYEEIKAINSFLVFFVACENIESYDDGYRATITIGNPHSFGFTRVKGVLSYGESLATALVNERQRVQFTAGTDLRPGTWIHIQVPIAAAELKDVGKIIVQFEISGAMGRVSEPPSRTSNVPQLGGLL